MFSIFKSDPTKKLRKEYDAKLEQGMQAQRKGDIKSYAMLSEEAEKIWSEIEALEAKKAKWIRIKRVCPFQKQVGAFSNYSSPPFYSSLPQKTYLYNSLTQTIVFKVVTYITVAIF